MALSEARTSSRRHRSARAGLEFGDDGPPQPAPCVMRRDVAGAQLARLRRDDPEPDDLSPVLGDERQRAVVLLLAERPFRPRERDGRRPAVEHVLHVVARPRERLYRRAMHDGHVERIGKPGWPDPAGGHRQRMASSSRRGWWGGRSAQSRVVQPVVQS